MRFPSSIRKYKGIYMVAILLFIIGLSILPQAANASLCLGVVGFGCEGGGISRIAGEVGDAVGGIAVGLVTLVIELMGALLWQIVSLLSRLFTFVIYDFNQQVGFYDNLFVQAGWLVVRDIMNWFFVIIFLVSAIATILDLKRYAARAVLPRLIFVAILINFSLWITGFAVNVAQQVSSIFVTAMAGDYDDIGQAFLSASMIKDMRVPDFSVVGDFIGDSIGEQLITFIQKLFATAMLGAYGFAMGFLTVALILRNIMVWVLMIISPMAFIAAILPSTQSFWHKWLTKFTEYTIFLPIAVFFIWLGTFLIGFLDTLKYETSDGVAYGVNSSAGGSAIITTVQEGMNFTMIIIFLFMSVIVTKWFAKEAGSMASKTVGKATIGALGVGAFAGRRGGAFAANRSRLTEKAGNLAGKIPGAGRIQERLYGTQRAYDQRRGDKQKARNLDNASDTEIEKMARRAATSPKVMDRDAEILRQANKRGIDLSKDTGAGWSEKRQVAAAKKLKTMGLDQDVIDNNPHLAARAGMLKSQNGKATNDDAEIQSALDQHFETVDPRKFGQLAGHAFTDEVVEAIEKSLKDPDKGMDARHIRAMARNDENPGGQAELRVIFEDLKRSGTAIPDRVSRAFDDPIVTAVLGDL